MKTAKKAATAIFPLVLLLLAGCNKGTPASSDKAGLSAMPNVAETKDIVPATPSNGTKAQLLAAAEPFEVLTETAFDPSAAKVSKTIADAQAAAPAVRPLLPASAQSSFDRNMADIKSAGAAANAADLAQSSIENYRTLVTQGAGGSPVPAEVSLLDYAGFRYAADLKATPIRWSDMTAAVDFAKQNWAIVKPQIKDSTTASKFQATIDNMAAAAAAKNVDLAKASGGAELDLVDLLEKSFNTP